MIDLEVFYQADWVAGGGPPNEGPQMESASDEWVERGALGIVAVDNYQFAVVDANGDIYARSSLMEDLLPWLRAYAKEMDRNATQWRNDDAEYAGSAGLL